MTASPRLIASLLALVAVAVPALACGSFSASAPSATTQPREPLNVFASARVRAPIEALAEAFEREHPEVAVRLTFGLEDELGKRLKRGEKADLVIGSPKELEAVGARPVAGTDPIPLAFDKLQVVVPGGNPKGLKDPRAIFADPALRTGVCDPSGIWWCGRAAAELARTLGYTSTAEVEKDPARLLDRVATGELDAALLYRTETRPRADAVTLVDVDPAQSPPVRYDVVRVRSSTPAVQFVQFLRDSEAPREVLAGAGLQPVTGASSPGR